MIKRRFGKTDVELSQLGFGCMRFPIIDTDDPRTIDESEATEMIHYAIDHGVNYLDTAYGYHMEMSERFVGKALRKGYRKKTYLATKMPIWLVKGEEDSQKHFDEQLKRLQTDTIDMYLLHALGKDFWKTVKECNILRFLDRIRDAGKIQFAGFSFHDELPLFKEIVDGYDKWTFCQIQYNYMDTEFQAGTEGLKYAYSKGLAVVIMEPIIGGMLAVQPPKDIQVI